MKSFAVNVFKILCLVQATECVISSWLWEVQFQKGSASKNSSLSLDSNGTQQKYCTKDRHCGRGYCHRHYRTCHMCKSISEMCRRDHACCKGFECVFGCCRKVVKSGNYLSRCRNDSHCKKGLCCAKSHGEFVCKAMLRKHQRCAVVEGGVAYTVNHDCPCDDGLICKKKRVRRKRIKGTIASKQKTKIRVCQKIP